MFYNLDKLEENVGTKISTDEFNDDNIANAKNYLQYSATLTSPE
jgi:hypothetical protein